MNFAQVKRLAIPEGNVLRITDSSGRVLWWADKTPPTLVVNAPPSSTKSSSITISGTVADDSGIGSVTVTVNGTKYNAAVDSNGSWSVSVSLATGNNSISVVATDKMGNTTSSPSYTVKRLAFVTVYDWGTVYTGSLETSTGYRYAKVDYVIPSGYDLCTVMIVDGVEYDVAFYVDNFGYVSYNDEITCYWLKSPNGRPAVRMYYNHVDNNGHRGYVYPSTVAGDHTIKIGYYA